MLSRQSAPNGWTLRLKMANIPHRPGDAELSSGRHPPSPPRMSTAEIAAVKARAKQAATAALRDARERALVRSELSASEVYVDAWARYAISLEERLRPAATIVTSRGSYTKGSGQRPMPLPPATAAGPSSTASREAPAWEQLAKAQGPDAAARSLVAGTASVLQTSLGAAQWEWHEAHAGESASVPLSWLVQIEAGVAKLQAAASREPALRMELAAQRVRADAAEEESARRLSMAHSLEDELADIVDERDELISRIRELEGRSTAGFSEGDEGEQPYEPYERAGGEGGDSPAAKAPPPPAAEQSGWLWRRLTGSGSDKGGGSTTAPAPAAADVSDESAPGDTMLLESGSSRG